MHSLRARLVAILTLVASAAALCAAVITFAPTAEAATTSGPTIAAGERFSMVLGANGQAFGFGANDYGQLGNGTSNGNSNPVPSGIGPAGMIAVAAGANHGVGLTSDGLIWTFGNNRWGQLGRATNAGTNLPNSSSSRVQGIDRVTAISAGTNHTLALRSDGTVWGFGTNLYGELGTAVAEGVMTTVPVQIPGLTQVIAIAAGLNHSLVLRADGKVWAFGQNYYGELGSTTNNLTSNANLTPTEVAGLTGVSAIAAGTEFSLALRGDGTVWGFGGNFTGSLGTATNSGTVNPNPTPIQASVLSGIIAISASGLQSLALKQEGGLVFAFGVNDWGQLGNGINSGTFNPNPTPTAVPGLNSVTGIAAGGMHSLALLSGGGLASFGRNVHGELGRTANGIPNPVVGSALGVSGLGQPPTFASVVPARLLDSRPGATTIDGESAGGDVRQADLVTMLRVTGRGGVSNDATSVVLNVTVTQAQGTGFITAYPCGSARPNASNLNYSAGSTIANVVIAKVGENGNVCLYTSAAVQLIADVSAYYRSNSAAFGSLEPARLLDTRPGASTVDGESAGLGLRSANSITELQVWSRGLVPNNSTAVALNITVTEAQGTGYVTAYPCGAQQPDASNLNYDAGATIPNSVVVKVGTGGKVCLFTSAATHLIADVNAFLRDNSTSATVVPARLLDSRPGGATIDDAFEAIGLRPTDSVTEVKVTSRGGVPFDATAVVVNVTVTQAQGGGYVTVYPCGSPRPNASNINFAAGATIANLVIAKVGDNGNICLYSFAATHLIVDVNGYYS